LLRDRVNQPVRARTRRGPRSRPPPPAGTRFSGL